MKTWKELIKQRMNELNISQSALGEIIGKTQGGVGHWLNGRRDPSIEEISMMMKALGIDEILLSNDGTSTLPNEKIEYVGKLKQGFIKVKGEAVMGIDTDLFMIEEHNGWLKIHSPDPQAFALKVRGDSMYPRINSGEFVVIEPNSQICPGDEVFVRTLDGRNMIKIMDYLRDDEYRFSSVNKEHKPFTIRKSEVDKVEFVGAIVKRTRYVDILDLEDK